MISHEEAQAVRLLVGRRDRHEVVTTNVWRVLRSECCRNVSGLLKGMSISKDSTVNFTDVKMSWL
jgi:hypothetical protein